ncbi:MAG: delta-aminolevulinic acid dehydratase [Bacteroidales bacterium]|nr:delta-aminolevulinic acid dehydratase [Bacteroidales bacterium]
MIYHLKKLKDYIRKEQFAGYDPYDALNSPLLKRLAFGNKYLRIAFTQGLKRLPFNLRPFLLVPKDHNPKGLGLFLWGYAKLYKHEKNPNYIAQIEKLLDLLNSCKTEVRLDTGLRRYDKGGLDFRLRGNDKEKGGNDKKWDKNESGGGHGWGYNFDWQSRAFFIPKYTPTIVNSSFIGHALLDTYAFTGLTKARAMALPIGDFILQGLHRLEEKGTLCFSYTPIDNYFVHNANLLGASLLIRLFKETGKVEYKDTALTALAYSIKHQHDDGSWFYAEKDTSNWIDSFHTGFNLQAIRYFLDLGFAKEYRPQFDKGVRFYAENFFLADGTPKYYHDRVYPIDIHSPAQAIVFFSGMGKEYDVLTKKILDWMIKNMQGPNGAFYFQKHKYYTNKIPYMRWSQAWAFHALTEYLLHYDDK